MSRHIIRQDLIHHQPEGKKAQYVQWCRLTFARQCDIAKRAVPGDVWVSARTGRSVTIVGNSWQGLQLKHETGRATTKQHHYFAYDYYPENPAAIPEA